MQFSKNECQVLHISKSNQLCNDRMSNYDLWCYRKGSVSESQVEKFSTLGCYKKKKKKKKNIPYWDR